MVSRWALPALLILASMLAHPAVAANSRVTIKVVDAQMRPLSGAIVELPGVQAPLVAGQPAVMDQVDKRFVPELLLVQRGRAVSFPNSDNIRHHVYSFSPAKTFELKLYAGKPKHPVVFDTAGVVLLGCNIHDSMVGYIYVAEGPSAMTTDAGEVYFDVDEIPGHVYVWHPLQRGGPEVRARHVLDAETTHTIMVHTSQPAPRDTFGDRFGAP
ncbi:methylamine utilization protein [Teredinibacter turnerae]|uniref:methylamine utilization protein n=1 Tax=Teredinibacter turnerae TaxID=2426 RepID=UPI000A42B5C7|nr:methylamine utilization protein [Teredinibacter turnerae]